MKTDNFKYKKSLGQNFIKDDNIIDKIVKHASVDNETLVIEIGPGAGSLSKKIIPLAGYAILYEIDIRLNEVLNEVLDGNDNYKVIFNDFLKQDVIKDIEAYNYKKKYVVANLPYYITTPIITKLINEIYPDRIVIMVQEEVADRLCASCGSKEYGMISAFIGSKYDIKKLFRVSRNCFEPVPKVDSAVISLDKINKYKIDDNDIYEKLLKDAFQFKRKNLRNNLKKYDLNKIENILNKNNYSLNNRAEELPIDEFVEIANNLNK